MAIFDLNKIAKNVQKSAEGIAKAVTDTIDKAPKVNVADVMKDATKKGQEALDSIASMGKSIISKPESAENKSEKGSAKQEASSRELIISTEGALKVIYFLMSIDGTISPEEEEKFDSVGQELDPSFDDYKTELLEGCQNVLKDVLVQEDYYDIIYDQVSEVIRSSASEKQEGIRGKLLLWDLYAVAYSDEDYSESEKRLIRAVCRAMHIDAAVALEMEQTLRTILAIEKEENWLKTTTRQYSIVEDRLNELADRKQAIMQGIQMLIAD